MDKRAGQPDEVVVKAARAGDRSAFGVLVDRYQDLVFAIACGQVGDPETARDIAQDALLASLEGLPLLRSPSKYGNWVARITRKLCAYWHRSEGYRRALMERVAHESVRTKMPEEVLVAQENKAIVRGAIDQLTPKLREAIVLYYLRGRSVRETARLLQTSEQAVWKRLERGRRQIRDHLAAQVESTLGGWQPGEEFRKGTLAVIPAGSLCGRLGLEVMRAGAGELAGEAMRHAALRVGSMIVEGGMAVTAKKTTVAIVVLVLLSAGGTTYLVMRSNGTGAQRTAAEDAVDGVLGAAERAKALDWGQSEVLASLWASFPAFGVEELNELIADAGLELDEMDEETRLYIIRQLVRDALERNVSLESFQTELDFAEQLLGGKRSKDARAVLLGIYDAASNPENMVRVLRDDAFSSGQEGMVRGLTYFMLMSGGQINGTYLNENGGAQDAREWYAKVSRDIDVLLGQGIVSGTDRAILMEGKDGIDSILAWFAEKEAAGEDVNGLLQRGIIYGMEGETTESPETRELLSQRVTEYLEEYLHRDDLTPEDRWASSLSLAIRYEDLGRYDDALGVYWELGEEAKVYGYEGNMVDVLIERAIGNQAVAALPSDDQAKVEQSRRHLIRMLSLLEGYADRHGGDLPPDIEGFIRNNIPYPSELQDPFTGQPYEFTSGSGWSGPRGEMLVRTPPKSGLCICIHSDLSTPVVRVEK